MVRDRAIGEPERPEPEAASEARGRRGDPRGRAAPGQGVAGTQPRGPAGASTYRYSPKRPRT